MRYLVATFFGLAGLGVVLGFLGTIHPAGDSIGLLRPIFGALCLIGIPCVAFRRFRVVLACLGSFAVVTIFPSFIDQNDGTDMRLYSKNIWWANDDVEEIAADILAADVDVVMLQEVSERTQSILPLLADRYPYQHWCSRSRWMGEAVLSRTPIVDAPLCTPDRGAAAAMVEIDGAQVWAVSVHIPWPWPYESADNEADVETLLSQIDGPVVIAGDFNIFPWAARVQRVAKESGTEVVGPTRPTLTLWNMPLPIDHVLASGGGRISKRPLLGSDHHGLVANVDF